MNRAAACAAALSGLPGMGPAGLVRILDEDEPEAAWDGVRSGRIERPVRGGRLLVEGGGAPGCHSWSQLARRIDPCSWWAPIAERGVRVTWRGHPEFPSALRHDPHPPGVLFWLGDLTVLEKPVVAVVGTRNATPDGRAVAYELGRDLASAGICVVSGLALGIDGAAHAGALDAVGCGRPGTTAGVAASGVDVPYPRRHTDLWRQVTTAGVVVSENLPGRPAQAWRFPSRNRVIAGLARMVVVVESHASGGSLITAEAALERGIEVRVVPGPVRSPASAGSNQLLYDGPGPVRDAQDVLDALGMVLPTAGSTGTAGPAGTAGSAGTTDPAGTAGPARSSDPDGAVLAALGWRPATVSHLMLRSGLDAPAVIRALERFRAARIVAEEGGWWARI